MTSDVEGKLSDTPQVPEAPGPPVSAMSDVSEVSEVSQTADLTAPGQAVAPTTRIRLTRLLRALYLVALLVAVAVIAIVNRSEIAGLLEGSRPLLVAAALVATFPLIALGSRIWVTALRMLGHEIASSTVMLATSRALPARYVPLKLSFSVGRVALLRTSGVPLAPLMATAGLEMAISVAVAGGFGLALLGASGTLPGGTVWTVPVLVATVIGASPAVGGKVMAWLAARRSVPLTLTWRGYAGLMLATTCYWAWACLAFVLYVRAFPGADSFSVLQLSGAFMVSWAVGFLAVFAPQGFGVAEASLVALLATDETETLALAVVFGGYRAVQLIRDVTASPIAEVISMRRARQGSPQSG